MRWKRQTGAWRMVSFRPIREMNTAPERTNGILARFSGFRSSPRKNRAVRADGEGAVWGVCGVAHGVGRPVAVVGTETDMGTEREPHGEQRY